MSPPVVSIIARSGTGKTTLLEKLIRELKSRGFKVGAIKHDAHRFEIDHEGKDSWRLAQAGADTTLISSSEKLAMVKVYQPQSELSLAETVATYFQDVDIVLTEGFKKSSMPKVEVYRHEKGEPLLCSEDNFVGEVVAIASDCELNVDVPLYNINDYVGLSDLISERYLS